MDENEKETVTENEFNTKEFLEKVEDAARKGALKGSRKRFSFFGILKAVLAIAIIMVFGSTILSIRDATANLTKNLRDFIDRDAPLADHDLTLENKGFNGFLGYTAADFQDAILGDSSQLKKLEVYSMDISEAVTLTNTGLANLKILTKTQLLTYKGTATYTVDLGKLTRDNITLDAENLKVHLRIPHAALEPININENDIEFGDIERGFLALGEMSMEPEDLQQVQAEARNKMNEQLEKQNVSEKADRFARMSVWKIYQPLINKVTTGYSLVVDMD
ncbi:MAG: DUF4230 domain-containing protein [Solobacterium sp.]|nr:DUF4230 domain-containing protein [Solobacterium sp.]